MLFKTFFFFVFLVLLGTLIQYTVDTPGIVVFDWYGYEIQTTALFAAICLFMLTLFFFVWGRVWSWFMAAPKNLAVRRDKKREAEGFTTFFKGLDALAAGDGKKAQSLALKTSELLPDKRLPHMIRAEAAQLLGDENEAMYHFKALSEDKNSSFLGLRGLLSQSYKSKHYEAAYEYAQKAYAVKPNSPWVLRIYFEVLLHLQKFEEALDFLEKLDKKAVLTFEESNHHEGFICIELAKRNRAQNRYREAIKYTNFGLKALPSFTELGELKVEIYREKGDKKKAVETLVDLWQDAPKKEIFALWLNATNGTKNQLKQAEKITKNFLNTAEGNIALGLAYMENEEWEKAENTFQDALKYATNQFIYSKLLLCAQRQNKDEKIQKKWQEKALNSPSYQWDMDNHHTAYKKWCETYLHAELELGKSKPEQLT
jgi:HemY protein